MHSLVWIEFSTEVFIYNKELGLDVLTVNNILIIITFDFNNLFEMFNPSMITYLNTFQWVIVKSKGKDPNETTVH